MPRFFCNSPPVDNALSLFGDDAIHIGRSLRMRLGDVITVCCDKTDYSCKILRISDKEIALEVISQSPSPEPDVSLTLFMAVPKLDKLELIVQKATELGAVEIVPVMTRRCVSRPDKVQFAKKRERLSKIALEAAKQSGRGIVPAVSDIISLECCVERMKSMDTGLILYENGGQSLKEFEYGKGDSVGILVGSEGGFDPEEVALCEQNGIKKIWLGDRILRCETAPISAISIIMCLSGNM